MAEVRHYGVKGMHWGVRKARTGQLADFARVHEKVAAGKGTLGEKHFAAKTNSLPGMAKRGLKKQSAISAKKARDEIERLSTGKAKIGDVLRAYGSANVRDIVRSRRDDNNFEDLVKKRTDKGVDPKKAEKSVKRRQAAAAFAVAGALAVGKALLNDGGQVLSMHTAQRAQTNRDRANAAGTRGLPRHATNGPTFAKKNKGGAFTITSI